MSNLNSFLFSLSSFEKELESIKTANFIQKWLLKNKRSALCKEANKQIALLVVSYNMHKAIDPVGEGVKPWRYDPNDFPQWDHDAKSIKYIQESLAYLGQLLNDL